MQEYCTLNESESSSAYLHHPIVLDLTTNIAPLKPHNPNNLHGSAIFRRPSYSVSSMDTKKILKDKREQLRRRKLGLFKRGHKFGKAYEGDVVIILRKNGQYYTYRSLNQEYWPPTMKQIVSQYSCLFLL